MLRFRIAPLLFVSALFLGLHGVRAQTLEELNLGFEQAGEKPSKPKAWTVSGDGFATDAPGYEVGLDEAEAKSGKRSLKMKATGLGSFGNAYLTIPGDVAAGKHVKISGWIKTKDVAAKGYAGLWCRIDGRGMMLAHDNMTERIDAKGNVTVDDRGVRGTTDWKLYTVQHDVPSSARAIVFGALLTSEGTAWWDDFAVEIDGKPYRGKSLAELAAEREPKPAELEWLRKNAIIFKTDRAESGFDDLQPLKAIIGDAPHRRPGRGHARHGRVLPHEAPPGRVPRLGEGLHTLRHRGQHARGVPRERLRPEWQGRPQGLAPGYVFLDVGHAGSARHDPLDEEVQYVG